MKERMSFVSNSSSSSFLVPHLPEKEISGVGFFKLPEDVWKSIEKNHFAWDGKKLNLSGVSDQWYLTTIIYDCVDAYSEFCDAFPESIMYEEWHGEPDMYMDDGELVKFQHGYDEFYLLASDFGGRPSEGIPTIITLREEANKIFNAKRLSMKNKLAALKKLFEY